MATLLTYFTWSMGHYFTTYTKSNTSDTLGHYFADAFEQDCTR